MALQPLRFGVNLNNREPLIAPDYTLSDLLSLAERAEALGFDSVWVGDSLFSKPRWEPITLLSAISQRTSRVKLGTACMVSGTRHPLYLALEWATLDQLSAGRTILGTGMGNPEEGVRREYAAIVAIDAVTATGSRWVWTMRASGNTVSSGPSCSRCCGDFSSHRSPDGRRNCRTWRSTLRVR